MLLEWIRRRDPDFEIELKDYLFTKKQITDVSVSAELKK